MPRHAFWPRQPTIAVFPATRFAKAAVAAIALALTAANRPEARAARAKRGLEYSGHFSKRAIGYGVTRIENTP